MGIYVKRNGKSVSLDCQVKRRPFLIIAVSRLLMAVETLGEFVSAHAFAKTANFIMIISLYF